MKRIKRKHKKIMLISSDKKRNVVTHKLQCPFFYDGFTAVKTDLKTVRLNEESLIVSLLLCNTKPEGNPVVPANLPHSAH